MVWTVDYLKQYNRRKNPSNRSNNADPRPGEVWWVANLDGVKDRPVLVIARNGDTVTYRKCTSSTGSARPKDVIEDHISAGLEKETYVDAEVRTIARNRMVRRLGKLCDLDMERFGLL